MTSRLIVRATLGIILGAVLGIYLLHENTQFNYLVEKRAKALFSRVFRTYLSCRLARMNLFSPTCVFEDVFVCPKDQEGQQDRDWFWRAKEVEFSFSWFDFIVDNRARLYIECDQFEAFSRVDQEGNVAMLPHLSEIFSSTAMMPIPLKLKGHVVKNGSIHMYTHDEFEIHVGIRSSIQVIGRAIKSVMSLDEGQVVGSGGIRYIDQLSGMVRIDHVDENHSQVEPDLRFSVPAWQQNNPCLLSGLWDGLQGMFEIKTVDGACSIDALHLFKKNENWMIESNGSCNLNYLLRLMDSSMAGDTISGNCLFQCSGDLFNINNCLQGHVEIKQPMYEDIGLDKVVFSFDRQHGFVDGTITAQKADASFAGQLIWDEKNKSGDLHITNASAVSGVAWGFWEIRPEQFRTQLSIDHFSTLKGTFACTFDNEKTDETIGVSGQLKISPKGVHAFGTFGSKYYILVSDFVPRVALKKFMLVNRDGTIAVQAEGAQATDKRLQIKADYPSLHALLPSSIKDRLPGEGKLVFQGSQNESCLTGSLSLKKGHIRLPEAHNFIQDLHAECELDLKKGTVVVRDMALDLYKGFISCDRATMFFDSLTGRPRFVSCPLVFNQCFVGWKKDFHATVSGTMTYLSEMNNQPVLRGKLIVEDGGFEKGNVDAAQNNLYSFFGTQSSPYGFDLQTDIKLVTKTPIAVSLPFLKTNIKIDLAISKSLHQPDVFGSVELCAGELIFPYKNLFIQRGRLHFAGSHLFDPAIELVAKNRIKRHNITLHISGSVQNPHITFESVPALSEEQILVLLLVGSEQELLNNVAPALILNNLTSLLLHQAKSKDIPPTTLQKMLKPLDHVRLVPRFIDQTGRAGLGGTLEIDVNDRLRAIIEKELTLSGDAKLELEYLLTDDVSVHGIKDEQGDLGGEVEIRWKF